MAVRRVILFVVTLMLGLLVYKLSWAMAAPIRITLAIFVIAVILWVTEWIPLFLTSFVILFLESALLSREGVLGAKSIRMFFEPFFSPIITLFLGGFALSFAMRKFGMDRMIGEWILKKSRGDPRRLVTFLLLSSTFVSMWISNAATTLLFLMAILPVIQENTGTTFRRSALMAITIGSTMGGLLTPIGTPPNAVAMGALLQQGVPFSFAQWMAALAPVSLLVLTVARLGLSALFPIDPAESLQIRPAQQIKWSGAPLGVLAIFLVTVLLWLTAPWHGVSDGVVALVPFILLFLSGLLGPKDLKEMGWDTLLLVGGGMSLGVALKESGLAGLLVDRMTSGPMTVTAAVVAIAVLSLVLSTFVSDTVATSLTLPLVVALQSGEASGILLVAASSAMALALPVASPSNAIVFSSGYVKSSDFLKIGGLISVAGILAAYLVYKAYWTVFF